MISCVTITFNNFEELVTTLKSNENLPIERVVINGGTCEKTKKFLKDRSDISSLTEKDKGISDAFNKGVQHAKGDAIWFLNSGDRLLDPGFIAFAEKNLGEFDFCYADILIREPGKEPRPIRAEPNRSLGLGMPYLHPALIMKKNIFDEVGLFDLNFRTAMDFDLVCRMSKKNYRGIYYPQPVVEMEGSGVSATQLLKVNREIGIALRKSDLMNSQIRILFILRSLRIYLRHWMYKAHLGSIYEVLKNSGKTLLRVSR